MPNLERLKGLNVDKLLNLDECVAAYVDATQMACGFEELGMDNPDWLNKSTDIIKAEIDRRTREDNMRMLKEVEAELEGLRTHGERRSAAQDRLAQLQKALGVSPAKVRAGK